MIIIDIGSQNGWHLTSKCKHNKNSQLTGARGIPGGIQVQSFFTSRNKCLVFTVSVSVVPFLLHLGLFHLVQVQVVRPGGWKLFSSFLTWIILLIQDFKNAFTPKIKAVSHHFPKLVRFPYKQYWCHCKNTCFPKHHIIVPLLIPRSHTWMFLRWSFRRCFFVFLSSSGQGKPRHQYCISQWTIKLLQVNLPSSSSVYAYFAWHQTTWTAITINLWTTQRHAPPWTHLQATHPLTC